MNFERLLKLLKEYIEWETEYGENPDNYEFNFEDFKEFIHYVVDYEKEYEKEFII
jgi:hypothetical protein